jgi:hypothetical protein
MKYLLFFLLLLLVCLSASAERPRVVVEVGDSLKTPQQPAGLLRAARID